MDFWRRAARIYRLLKVRHEVIRDRMRVTQRILERLWKRVQMVQTVSSREDNRWPKRIMTWSPEGRRRRRRPKVKWKKEVERVTMERNLTISCTVNGHLAATANRRPVDHWKTNRQTDRQMDG
jgi:hypothetical protein